MSIITERNRRPSRPAVFPVQDLTASRRRARQVYRNCTTLPFGHVIFDPHSLEMTISVTSRNTIARELTNRALFPPNGPERGPLHFELVNNEGKHGFITRVVRRIVTAAGVEDAGDFPFRIRKASPEIICRDSNLDFGDEIDFPSLTPRRFSHLLTACNECWLLMDSEPIQMRAFYANGLHRVKERSPPSCDGPPA